MDPKLLVEEDFFKITKGLNIKKHERFNVQDLELTFIEAISKPQSLWFIKLVADYLKFYFQVDKEHFEQYRNLLHQGPKGISKVLLELLRKIEIAMGDEDMDDDDTAIDDDYDIAIDDEDDIFI